MKQIELENVTHQMRLRVYLDPLHTNLDWVEGRVDLDNINGACLRIEADNWPSVYSSAHRLAGGLMSLEPDYDYFELEP